MIRGPGRQPPGAGATAPATIGRAPSSMPDETPTTTRHIPCPSCKAEIEVGPDGEPVAEDVAHFDMHKAYEQRLERLEKERATQPAEPAPTAENPQPTPETQPAPKPRNRWATVQFPGE